MSPEFVFGLDANGEPVGEDRELSNLPGTLVGYGYTHVPIWLLDDVVVELSFNAKQPKDVRWVGSKDGKVAISWQEFAPIAAQFDASHSGTPRDLVIVGDDWWLSVNEDDGEQYWEYQTQPVRHPNAISFTNLTRYKALSEPDEVDGPDEEADE